MLHIGEEQKQFIISECQNGGFANFGEFEVENVETLDGFKYFLPEEQWVMIRPSGTEPVLRIYAESADKEKVEHLLKTVVDSILERAGTMDKSTA